MRIAFCNRDTWDNPLGGDGIQMLKTKEALERLFGLEIDIVTHADDLSKKKYDLVHIFNYATMDITKTFFDRAEQLNLKVVSSSIFWEYKYAMEPLSYRLGLVNNFVSSRFMKRNILINKIIAILTGKPVLLSSKFRKAVKLFVEKSWLILPNSKEEGELLLKFAHCKAENKKKMRVVYNGVDLSNVKIMSENEFFEKYKIPQNYILQVSRIQYIKNQLNLLTAMKKHSHIPIVFVGKVIETAYYKKLREIASKRGNVYFIEEIPHDDVYSFYRYAKCHVLLSLRESPGLVSIEALSQRCPAVVSDGRFAPVNTYFERNVQIVNPLNLLSIEKGVLSAYKQEKVDVDVEKFSWDNVALQTYNAYKQIV